MVSNILHRIFFLWKDSNNFWHRKMTLKVRILRCLRRLFIILVILTMTWFSEKMLIPVWVYREMAIEKFLYLSSLGWLLQEYNFWMGRGFQVWKFHLKISPWEEKPCLPRAYGPWEASFSSRGLIFGGEEISIPETRPIRKSYIFCKKW